MKTLQPATPYLLKVGAQGEKRLDILNRVYRPTTHSFLVRAGLRKGLRVLEIGCGTGETSLWMARQVGPSGYITGIDISHDQVQLAQRRQAQMNIKNAEFKTLSTFELDQLSATFDLVYCRFVLTHLKQIESVLHLIQERLTQGGIFACEESTITASFCYPENKAFTKWVQIWNGLKASKGLSTDIGLKLPGLLRKAGFTHITSSLAQPVLNTPVEKSLLRLNILESLDYILDENLLTPSEASSLHDELEQLEHSDDTFIGFVRNTQVMGSLSSKA